MTADLGEMERLVARLDHVGLRVNILLPPVDPRLEECARLTRQAAVAIMDLSARLRAAEGALRRIEKLKPEPIGRTGFQTGPLAMLNTAQRIAKDHRHAAQKATTASSVGTEKPSGFGVDHENHEALREKVAALVMKAFEDGLHAGPDGGQTLDDHWPEWLAENPEYNAILAALQSKRGEP